MKKIFFEQYPDGNLYVAHIITGSGHAGPVIFCTPLFAVYNCTKE